ncbi:Protein timeless-like protein [Armadillidium vulgare]|nr:Protein timeless-like protein [Armadillidium vulgare]
MNKEIYNVLVQTIKKPDCLETIKDLIRYLKRDDDSHHIRRALGETKVLQTDLIPILKFYAEDKELFDVTLRLVVNLTNPVLLLFKEELPEEKITRQQYLQMIGHQQSFKASFADEAVWSILVGRLGEILNKDWDEREEEERLVVERILILVRNILAVAASPDEEKRTDDDASIHDQVLWALHLARFEDLLLYISSSNNEQELCLHIIEIISKMLKEQDASQLASAGIQRSHSEKEKDEKELMEIRRREALAKQQKIKKHYSARHSRFGGTYYIMNMKSISDRDMIAHKHVTDIESLSFDQSKRAKKTPKNRMPLKDCDVTRRSTLAIRLFLQEFCIEFLNGAFNSLMYIVKDNLNRARAQEHDEIYYLWAIEFFLKFNRSHNFKIELTTEVLNIQTFHYIQTLMENYYETMTTDKKKIPLWSRRMHKGIKAYQELLMTLSFMDKSDIESVRESSRILKNKVFYVVEYRELALILLQNFDELKMTMNYLRDLVETTHVFLKLLEGICGKQRHLVVQKKKVRKTKPKKKNVNQTDSLGLPTEEELVIQWDEKSDTLLSVIKGDMGDLPTTFPYDPVSNVPEEEQKEIAMKKINLLLRRGDLHEAVSLLRTSREIWPEGDIFGAGTMDPLEESLCLRSIFMANINPPEPTKHIAEEEEEMEEDSDEEEERQEVQFSEQEFNLIGFIRRFGHIKVLQAYCLLFKNFFKNSENVNHCILKMFHRLAWDCKLVAIFFQASLFKTFLKIFDEHDPSNRSHVDAVKFAKFIFKKFVQTAGENKKVFMELLFWKTNKDALEIECGYGNSESDNTKRAPWTEEEEDELRRLYEEFKDVQSEDKDVADHITDNLINRNRTRRAVIKKLKEMYIISDVKELRKKTVKTKESKQWTEEQIAELKSLVDEFKDASLSNTENFRSLICQKTEK